MSFPTLTELYESTRAKCGDTEVSGGQIYTNAVLLPHIQEAVRVMWRGLRNLAVPRVHKVFYFTLPANTSILHPSTALITDFSEPAGLVSARGGITSAAVTGATPGTSSLSVTCSGGHGLTTGNSVVLQQLAGLNGANVLCAVTVSSSTVFTANGVVATGTYTSGGTVVTSQNEFAQLVLVRELPASSTQVSAELSMYVYQEGVFRFIPASNDRQVRVPYWSSATVPSTGSDQVGFNDSIDFISIYAAAEACSSQGADARYAKLMNQAVGPNFSAGGYGGELRQLMVAAVRQRQLENPYSRGPMPFREQPEMIY